MRKFIYFFFYGQVSFLTLTLTHTWDQGKGFSIRMPQNSEDEGKNTI